MRSSIYEVCKAEQSSRQAYSRAIQSRYEDLGVGVESLRSVQVAGSEVAEPLSVWIFVWIRLPTDADICAPV